MEINTLSNILYWAGMAGLGFNAIYQLEMMYREQHKDETLEVAVYWKKKKDSAKNIEKEIKMQKIEGVLLKYINLN